MLYFFFKKIVQLSLQPQSTPNFKREGARKPETLGGPALAAHCGPQGTATSPQLGESCPVRLLASQKLAFQLSHQDPISLQ